MGKVEESSHPEKVALKSRVVATLPPGGKVATLRPIISGTELVLVIMMPFVVLSEHHAGVSPVLKLESLVLSFKLPKSERHGQMSNIHDDRSAGTIPHFVRVASVQDVVLKNGTIR